MSIPYLKQQGDRQVLFVHDQPFIMLAGEVHNSNSSTPEAMVLPWKKAKQLGMNTLLLPITWEQTEPEEGVFCFELVDGLIAEARRNGFKLGLLWFGAWKNAQCYYAPSWVKQDMERFHRAEIRKGQRAIRLENMRGMPYTTLSYLCEETCTADAKAFRALMAHIREIDSQEQTVITVQVENEAGIQGAAREHSDKADAVFSQPVPEAFVRFMRSNVDSMDPAIRACVEAGAESGDWMSVFGSAADEIFSAYHVASYIEQVAKAGKEAYPLPMSANCWLDKGQEPGTYPSGGPVAKMMEVWHYCAPSIDILAPDIYVPDFCNVCDQYVKRSNPLYIPESATHSYAGPRMLYSVGHYHGICYAPFGFEDLGETFSLAMQYLVGVDITDPALKTAQNTEDYYALTTAIQGMMPLLGKTYGTNQLQAAISELPEKAAMEFNGVRIQPVFQLPFIQGPGACLVCQKCPDEFYILLTNCLLSVCSSDPRRPHLDILDFEEGYFTEGKWHVTRRRNGDEAAMLIFSKPALLRLKVFTYS